MKQNNLPAGISKEDIEFGEALSKLKRKVIGYSEDIGLYEISSLWSGGTNQPDICLGTGKTKFELDRRNGENYMRFSLVSRHIRWLQGEILTVLEAVIDDERKLKATKDLVKDKISAKISWIYEQCGCPEEEQESLVDPE